MSMNLYIGATRKAFAFNAKGKKVTFTDRRNFACWQTPTEVTKNILNQKTEEEKVTAYIEWASSVCEPYEEDVYDYTAVPDENLDYPVIGRQMVNPAQEHGEKLREFLKEVQEEGFIVNFYML